MGKFLVVSFYTPDYYDEAVGLIQSLYKFDLEHEIEAVPSLGSWELNCNAKAEFIRRKLESHPDRSIIWLDADARVIKKPEMFWSMAEEELCDFGAHYRRGEGLLSGTLYFANNSDTLAFVEKWALLCEKNPTRWDQKNLTIAYEKTPSIVRHNFDVEYCYIDKRHQHEYPSIEPVILHRQASREKKGVK